MKRKVQANGEPRQFIKFGRKFFVAVALAAFAATLSAFAWPPGRFEVPPMIASAIGPVRFAEEKGYDAMMALRGPMSERLDPSIVVVGFDHADEVELKHNWAVPRRFHAQVIKNILADGAKLVVYDVLFAGPSPFGREDDLALDKVLRSTKKVVLTMRIDRDIARDRKSVEAPYHDDEDNGIDFEGHARVGLAEVTPDADDRVVRAMVPVMTVQGELIPSLPVAAYMALHNLDEKSIRVRPDAVNLGSLRIPRTGFTLTDPKDHTEIPFVKIDYPSASPLNMNSGSFSQAAGQPPDYLPGSAPSFAPGVFKDKIVFVGVTGLDLMKALGEQYPTAYTSIRGDKVGSVVRQEMPGVVLQALHFNALLQHTFVRETTFAGIWGMVFLTTLGAIAMVRRNSNLVGLLMVLGCGFLVFGFSYLSLKYSSLHVPWIVPIGLIFLSSAGVGWLESGSIKRRWAGYVSPAVLEQILQSEESIGARRYDASVMFGDIRGFTSFSEKHSPEKVVDLLNLHLEKMTTIIAKANGTIDKFLGDGILAVFGAPISFEGSAIAAVRAAWQMREAAMRPVVDAEGQSHVLATGFGITTGGFLGGDIGSKQLRNWTIIGDTVNLASRLQGVTGEPDVIIDEPTYDLVRRHVRVESLGAVTLKGKSQPVPCFKVVEWSETPFEDPSEDRPARDSVATK
ncbi:CHASE2 domain-containing protein [Fimbriimonas ginsengisoli]|uniref:Adenylate/guanylate cyclase with Chase sensor n=1 Tax=Fimbriimonas ginsengisoli Gsoil 348 TaxID=661478 RepID=A0A068NXK8_FIMGI|nr:adenylate/guanylate cyclase domain-containing protein [Fimbriimonas ginsengisoli]AIE86374.1 adenylate/guanylate cyclase with Chase sensor [Fimbriimonas ginsengisoli Gsoil 348]